jgi:hypothetical protein
MRLSTASFLAAAIAPLAVSAAPYRRTVDNGTLTVLQFAHVLELLETKFYEQALQKFQAPDFISAGFSSANIPVEQFTAIHSDEATHVTALESFITSFGAAPISTCQFDFSKVLTSVSTMLPVARLVENVGVGAYLGAAHLVGDQSVLTAAASIVTVEARHQTVLNLLSGATAISQAFDIALLPQEVLSIAGPFISGCDLGITPNAPLAVTNTGPITIGTSLQFSSPAILNSPPANGTTTTDNFHCQMLVGGLPFTLSLPIDQCVVPSGINGVVAIWVTSDDQPLNGDAVQRSSNAIVAGPLLTFIDSQPDSLGQLAHPNGASGNSTTPPPSQTSASTSTETLPPAQASSLLSSLGSTPTDTPSPPGNSTNTPPGGNNSSNGNPVIPNGVSMVPKPTTTP